MIKRTGNNTVAVVGWGRGMGHKGHMYLASSVITLSKKMDADAYFFISMTVGKDDPLLPEEKTQIYQTVFPKEKNIFQPQGNLNTALTELGDMGYKGVIVVVGADQKNAFQYLERPNKEGVPVYKTFGLDKISVVSRQETGDPTANLEGPRATPMREILLDPNSSEEQRFALWRDAMPEALSDKQVMGLMKKAEQRLGASHAKKKKLKEFFERVKPLLENATASKKAQILKKLVGLVSKDITETKSKAIAQTAKDLVNPPKIMQHRAKRDQEREEQLQYRDIAKRADETIDEARLHFTDPNARINVYYIPPKLHREGKVQNIAHNIPYKSLEHLIQALMKKFSNINPEYLVWHKVGNDPNSRYGEPIKENQDYLEEK